MDTSLVPTDVAESSSEPDLHELAVLCEGIEEPHWLKNVEPFVRKVLDYQGYREWELAVVFCNDGYIRALNGKYRQQDRATDVLSFAHINNPEALPAGHFAAGDIVISLDTLSENAQFFEVAEEEELKRLLIHGILHLAGWNHSNNSPEQPMLKRQENILSVLSEETIY